MVIPKVILRMYPSLIHKILSKFTRSMYFRSSKWPTSHKINSEVYSWSFAGDKMNNFISSTFKIVILYLVFGMLLCWILLKKVIRFAVSKFDVCIYLGARRDAFAPGG